MAAFSVDLRERVIAAIDGGMRPTDAARVFNVERRTIYLWLDLLKETSSLEPKTGYQNGHSHKITDMEKFEIFVRANGHRTIKEMAKEWGNQNNTTISKSAMRRNLEKIKFTSKKKLLITLKPTTKSVNSI